jgi:hypothetical protein
MTLNLMLTSRDAVYLSGDFRLVSLEDQAPLSDSYDTQKLIPVIRQEWSALVAYMGIASAPPLIDDMGQWIVDQVNAVPPGGDIRDLEAQLLFLNRRLDRIHGDRRVAISVVGFRDRQPFMMLLSNFIDLDGHVTKAGPQLRSFMRTPTRPEVRAVGTARPDVFERVRLVRMLQANAVRGLVPRLIRQAVADVNAQVARRSGGAISTACVSGYLLRSGAAAIGGHGIPAHAACFPNWLRRDLTQEGVVGFSPLTHDADAAPIQWRGTTAKIVSGRVVRTHEIANAGGPIFDGIERPHRPPTWRATRERETTSIWITCYTPELRPGFTT